MQPGYESELMPKQDTEIDGENGTLDLDKEPKDKKQETVLNLLLQEESESKDEEASKRDKDSSAKDKATKSKLRKTKVKDKGESKNLDKPKTQQNEISNGQWSFGQPFSQSPYMAFPGLNPSFHQNRFPLAFDYPATPYNPSLYQQYQGPHQNENSPTTSQPDSVQKENQDRLKNEFQPMVLKRRGTDYNANLNFPRIGLPYMLGYQNRANVLSLGYPHVYKNHEVQKKMPLNKKQEETSHSPGAKKEESEGASKESFKNLKKHEKQYKSSLKDYNKTMQKHQVLEKENNIPGNNFESSPKLNYLPLMNAGNQVFQSTKQIMDESQNRLLQPMTDPFAIGLPENNHQTIMDGSHMQPFMPHTFGPSASNNVINPLLGEGPNRFFQPMSGSIYGMPQDNNLLHPMSGFGQQVSGLYFNPLSGVGQQVSGPYINQYQNPVPEQQEINELGLNLGEDTLTAVEDGDNSHVIERNVIKPINTFEDLSTKSESEDKNEIPEDFIHQSN